MPKNKTLKTYSDSVVIRIPNARTILTPRINKDNSHSVVLQFQVFSPNDKSLRARHLVTHKGNVVNTGLNLSRETILGLISGLIHIEQNWDSMEKIDLREKDSNSYED